ncbi:hypothetical protein D3C77_414750 [compost metagenome]
MRLLIPVNADEKLEVVILHNFDDTIIEQNAIGRHLELKHFFVFTMLLVYIFEEPEENLFV